MIPTIYWVCLNCWRGFGLPVNITPMPFCPSCLHEGSLDTAWTCAGYRLTVEDQ